jgi:hypothetical protein
MVCSNERFVRPNSEVTRVSEDPTAAPSPQDVDLPDDLYPLVPEELVPAPVQPARLPRQPWWKVALVTLAGLAVVAVVAFGMVTLFDSFGNANRAQVEVAFRVAKAEISQDTLALKPLVPAATLRAVPESLWARIQAGANPPATSWSAPRWDGDALLAAFVYEGERRTVMVVPHGQDPNVVSLVVSTPGGGEIAGYVRLVREGSGYKALAVRLGDQTISFAPQDAAKTFGF